MPNKDVPHISLGNWLCGGSLLYIPPTPKKAAVKAKVSPKTVVPPKEDPKEDEPPKEEQKDDAPVTVSEGTDSPEDILKKAKEVVAQAEADAKKAGEEAKRMEDEENAKKAAEEEATKKKVEEQAAIKKKEEDEATAQKKEEDDAAAANKKAEDDAAAKQKAAEEDDAAKKKALDEKIEQLKKEKELMEIEHQNRKLFHDLAKEMAKGEQTVHATRAVSLGRFCSICGRRRHEGECDDTPSEPANNSFPVVNVNVFGGAEDAVKVTGDKDAAKTTNKSDDSSAAITTDDKDKPDAKTTTKSDAKPADNSKFSTEQDEKLLSLKSGNTTWANISEELGMAKKDCAARYKELTSKAASSASSSKQSSLSEGHVDLGDVVAVSADAVTDVPNNNGGEKGKKDSGSNVGSNKSQKNKQENGSDAGSNNSQKSGNHNKPAVEDPIKNTDNPKNDASKNNEDFSSSFTNKDNSPLPSTKCPPEQRTYIPISLSATIPLSGGRRILLPDATWTMAELECLAELECRYRELKWMKISADFFNHTARMIDPRIIEAKFGEGEMAEEEGKGEKEGGEEGKEGQEVEEGEGVKEVKFKVRLGKMWEQGVIPDELVFRISAEELRRGME